MDLCVSICPQAFQKVYRGVQPICGAIPLARVAVRGEPEVCEHLTGTLIVMVYMSGTMSQRMRC